MAELEERAAERQAQRRGARAVLADTRGAHQAETAEREAASAQRRELDEVARGLSTELGQARTQIANLEARTQELDQQLEQRAGELSAAAAERERLHGRARRAGAIHRGAPGPAHAEAERRGSELGAQLSQRTEERDTLRAHGEQLTEQLAVERARLQKARSKWGEDRVSLERAREALAAALSQIDQAEALSIE